MSGLDNPGYDRWKLNPPEPPESHFKCDQCHEEFYPGDRVYEIEGDNLCSACAIEWFDEQFRFAQEDECYGDD